MKCERYNQIRDWQLGKFAEALHDNEWFIGNREHRPSSESEAETDFLEHNCYDCPKKWRKEYCETMCDIGDSCEIKCK